ncbi:MAG: hypothetical protein LC808_23085 [Actinobacteria bacterium]|nr:hypothetical protein [Actinomycetota bacterium]
MAPSRRLRGGGRVGPALEAASVAGVDSTEDGDGAAQRGGTVTPAECRDGGVVVTTPTRRGDTSPGSQPLCHDVTFSPDSRFLATAYDDHTARFWDAHTGTELLKLTHDHEVRAVAFSPDGRLLATGDGEFRATLSTRCGPGTVRVWQLKEPERIAESAGASSSADVRVRIGPIGAGDFHRDTFPMNVLLLRWDTKPDKRIRRAFPHHGPTRRTSFYAANRAVLHPHRGQRRQHFPLAGYFALRRSAARPV